MKYLFQIITLSFLFISCSDNTTGFDETESLNQLIGEWVTTTSNGNTGTMRFNTDNTLTVNGIQGTEILPYKIASIDPFVLKFNTEEFGIGYIEFTVTSDDEMLASDPSNTKNEKYKFTRNIN